MLNTQAKALNSSFLSSLTAQFSPPAPVAASHHQDHPAPPPLQESYVPDPEPFSGELDKCRGFLLQCATVLTATDFSFRPVQGTL